MTTENIIRPASRRPGAPYKRIEHDLRRKIRSGVWGVGAQIPSRLQLAKDYGVDLSTVQKAVSTLLADGVVKSEGTRGTYVNKLPGDLDGGFSGAGFATGREFERSATERTRLPGATQTPLVAKKVVGVAGRFAPEISELLVPYILAQSLENALSPNKGVSLRFFDCFRNLTESLEISEGAAALLRDRVDVLCVIHPEPSDIDPIMIAAQRTGTPVVFVPQVPLPQPVVQVYVDHRYDGYQAAKYFLDLGHTDILFVMIGQHQWARERQEGVKAAIRYAGLPESAFRVFPQGDELQGVSTRKALKEPLQAWVRNEVALGRFHGAVIAANDRVAGDILEAAESLGHSPGLGFSILGFDDIPEARRFGLTTLRPPFNDIGREVASLLGKMLEHGEIRGESTQSRLVSEIVVRSTTHAASHGCSPTANTVLFDSYKDQ